MPQSKQQQQQQQGQQRQLLDLHLQGSSCGERSLVSFDFSPLTSSTLNSPTDSALGALPNLLPVQLSATAPVTPRAATATSITTAAAHSVLRCNTSCEFRRALAVANGDAAQRDSPKRQSRPSYRISSCNIDEVDALKEEEVGKGDDDDNDDVFDAASTSARPTQQRQQAQRRWALVRSIIADIRAERLAKKQEGWGAFFKHVRAMSEAEKSRQELYQRYDANSAFMSCLPEIPDSLLIAAGLPTRQQQQHQQLLHRLRAKRSFVKQ